MSEARPDPDDPTRPLALIGIALTGVLSGAVVGAATNAVNGWVSPGYFVTVLRWDYVEDVWRASVAQGVFEGLCFGGLFALLFTTGVGLITRATCRYGFAALHLLGIVAGSLVCWLLGGLAAIGLAALSPDFYRRAFIGVPREFGPMLRHAWVGGSIWGVQFGGLIAVALGLLILRGNWLRTHRPDRAAA